MFQRLILAALLLLTFSSAFADAPLKINYQGRLTDTGGAPLSDTTLDITFSIYRSDSTLEWTSGPQPVQISDGIFNYVLGSNVPLPSAVISSLYPRYLGIKVGDDDEIDPRTELVSVPYAYKVGTIDGALGGSITGSLDLTEDVYSHDDAFEIFYPSNILFQSDYDQGAEFMIGEMFNFDSEQGILRLGTVAEGYSFPSSDGTAGQVLSTDGSGQLSWTTGSSGGGNWTVTDNVLYTNNYWGVARGGAGNWLFGDSAKTHVNFGIACTTGTSGADLYYATVSGGYGNKADSSDATVGGGALNFAIGGASTVSGGLGNEASGRLSTIGGGRYNVARGQYATVAGGGGATVADSNAAKGDYSSVGGGYRNIASGDMGTVGGGTGNTAEGFGSTIAGGSTNSTSGVNPTIGGGIGNTAGNYSTVGGGQDNSAVGFGSSVGGGIGNEANGNWSTVPGGASNNADQLYTFAAGFGAKAVHPGTFVWADPTGGDFSSTGNNQFLVRAAGGVGINTNNPLSALHISGTAGVDGIVFPDNTLQTTASVGVGNWTVTDSVLYTNNLWGVARGAAGNSLLGSRPYTMVNFGTNSTTGTVGESWGFATISGGDGHTASGEFSTVGGGNSNTASALNSVVSGGGGNIASGEQSGVGAGVWNQATSSYTTVGGGVLNTATDTGAVVSGGVNNTAGGILSAVGGGDHNQVYGKCSYIGGGQGNTVNGDSSVICGGVGNVLEAKSCFIGGGGIHPGGSPDHPYASNHIRGGTVSSHSSIVGGADNLIDGERYNSILGGERNTIDFGVNTSWIGGGTNNLLEHLAYGSAICSGEKNTIRDRWSFCGAGYENDVFAEVSAIVCGGYPEFEDFDPWTERPVLVNRIDSTAWNSFIGCGWGNRASDTCAVVLGGVHNYARGKYSAIVGGGADFDPFMGFIVPIDTNSASGDWSAIVCGKGHVASGLGSFIGGGTYGRASGDYSVIAGGGGADPADSNVASGDASTVTGGRRNYATGAQSLVSGGFGNTASSSLSHVGGGGYNTASGSRASVPCGYRSTAGGTLSIAIGNRAKANHDGSVVIVASASGTPADSIRSGGVEQMVLRADGGLYLTNIAELAPYNSSRIITTRGGAFLSGDGTTWTNSSDRNKKENFESVDGEKILALVQQLEITRWNYRSDDESVKHIGPVAQDFYALFGVGGDDKSISTVDPAGIALAAIKELDLKTKELEQNSARIAELEDELAEVKMLLTKLLGEGR